MGKGSESAVELGTEEDLLQNLTVSSVAYCLVGRAKYTSQPVLVYMIKEFLIL